MILMILRADFKTDRQTDMHTVKHIIRIPCPLYFAKFLFSEIIDQRIAIRLRQYRRRHRFKLFWTPAAARL